MKLKNAVLVPDLVLKVLGLVSAPVVHNIAKSIALKMVFWHLAVDRVEGAYVEFGVASGNSMRSAEIAERSSHSKSMGMPRISRELVGFDTFESFSSGSEADSHPTWVGNNFSVSLARVEKRFGFAKNRVRFHKIDCSKVGGGDQSYYGPIHEYVNSELLAVALMDLDVGDPTEKALDWIRPKLQSGTIIIFDDFFAFRGNPFAGEAGAWIRFQERNPEISSRMIKTYGDGGAILQLTIA
jgi:hypothetical protein